jgi:hypothetical protein
MPYTAQDIPRPSSDTLRDTIPGWGADLDPRHRPSVPRERFDPDATGAHWDLPEAQPHAGGREKSVEHVAMPPVFGTSVPLRGVSGAVRRLAYDRFSEGRAAHWLLLLGADRIDAYGSQLRSLASPRPVPPLGTGLRTELGSGLDSRRDQGRADVKHQWLDPVVIAAPYIGLALTGRALWRRLRR